MNIAVKVPTVPQGITDQTVAKYLQSNKSTMDSIILDLNKWAKDISNLANTGVIHLATAHILVGNNLSFAADVAMSGEATIDAVGAVTLTNASVIGKVLTGYTTGSGAISATDSILSAFNKLGYDKHVAITLSSLTGFTLTGQAIAYTANYSLPLTADTGKGVTAYGWGNHASAGYAISSNVVPYSGATGDVALGVHNITSANLAITNWNSAYGWGDHSAVGYYKSGSNATLASITITAFTDGNVVTTNNVGLFVSTAQSSLNVGNATTAGYATTAGNANTLNSHLEANLSVAYAVGAGTAGSAAGWGTSPNIMDGISVEFSISGMSKLILATNGVAYAKIQQATAPCMLGKADAGAGNVTQINLDLNNHTDFWCKDGTFKTVSATFPALENTKIWIGDVSNVAQKFTLSGDVTMTAGGVVAIASDVIINTDIKSDAAIANSKLQYPNSMVLLSTQTANNSTSIAFSTISNSIYSSYLIVLDVVLLVNHNINLVLTVTVGGTEKGGTAYNHTQWRWVAAGSAASGTSATSGIAINSDGDRMFNVANAGRGLSAEIKCYQMNSTSTVKKFTWLANYNGSAPIGLSGMGEYLTVADAIDGFIFRAGTGNIASGTFKLYGLL